MQYLIDRKGYDFTEEFLRCCNSPAPLSIQVNTLKVSAADYVRALARAELSMRALRRPEGCITLPGALGDGARALTRAYFTCRPRRADGGDRRTKKRECACSTPALPRWKVFCRGDSYGKPRQHTRLRIHEKKLRLVRDGAQRLGIDIIETAAMDARAFRAELAERFDNRHCGCAVLGFGVIAKPEIRSKTPENRGASENTGRDTGQRFQIRASGRCAAILDLYSDGGGKRKYGKSVS